jgi:hypothetical protein
MQNTLVWIVEAVQDWSAQDWFNLAVALAIVTQAYIAYRIWRPRIEVYARIWVDQIKEAIPRKAQLDIANLSATGIWVEEVSINAEEAGLQIKAPTLNKPLGVLVPAFRNKRVRCDGYLYEAFLGTGTTCSRYVGKVNLRLRYRARRRWQHTRWETYLLLIDQAGVLEIEHYQREPLLTRTRTLIARAWRVRTKSE